MITVDGQYSGSGIGTSPESLEKDIAAAYDKVSASHDRVELLRQKQSEAWDRYNEAVRFHIGRSVSIYEPASNEAKHLAPNVREPVLKLVGMHAKAYREAEGRYLEGLKSRSSEIDELIGLLVRWSCVAGQPLISSARFDAKVNLAIEEYSHLIFMAKR